MSALTDGGERWGGLPLHMNLAVHSANSSGTILHQNPQVMATLKHRNHILTEVGFYLIFISYHRLYFIRGFFFFFYRSWDKKVKEYQH